MTSHADVALLCDDYVRVNEGPVAIAQRAEQLRKSAKNSVFYQ